MVRVISLVSVAAILLTSSLPVAPAGDEENLLTEWLPYVGSGLLGGVNANGNAVSVTPCDSMGVNGARFCAALENETRPDRLLMDVRDELGLRVAGFFQFRDANGTAISGNVGGSGLFCGAMNHYVPEKAATLTVLTRLTYNHRTEVTVPEQQVGNETIPETTVGANHQMICGSPGTTGKVTVVWRYNAPVEF